MNNISNAKKMILPLVAVIMFASCSGEEEQRRMELEQKAAELENQLYERDSAFNQILTVIDQAETQIREIKERENLVTVNAGSDMTENNKNQLIDDISQIDLLIKETNKKVASLANRLDKTNIEVAAFKRKIEKLTAQLNERMESITTLKQTLAQKNLEIRDLNTELTGLKSEFEQQSELVSLQVDIIDKKQKEINTAYYAIDKEKALIERGVISKEGGFLGLGATKDLMENVPTAKLVEIDRTLVDQFEVNGKKIELVTEHPSDSYKIIEEDGVVKFIKIQNPDEFWKISKYLVVAVKG